MVDLPPLLTPCHVIGSEDPFAAAVTMARQGADGGTMCFSDRSDKLVCALILTPETPLHQALQTFLVMMQAANDGIGAVVPAQIGISFAWPNRIQANGAVAGIIRMQGSTERPEQVPDWLIAGLLVDIEADVSDGEPGLRRDRTCLREEGADGIASGDLVASVGRHFLLWLDRWQRQGLAPVVRAWAGLESSLQATPQAGAGNAAPRWSLAADDNALLVIEGSTGTRRFPLRDALGEEGARLWAEWLR